MIKETGRVVAVEAGAIWIETIRQSACQSCAAQKGCGHGLLANIGTGRPHHVRVLPGEYNVSALSIDDQVEISVPERILVQGALMVYLLPLLTMLLGAVLGVSWLPESVGSQDVVAFIGSVLGFILGVLLVKYHSRSHSDDAQFQPVLVAVTGQA